MDKHVRFQEICRGMTQTYWQKNQDYGDSFAETFRKLGLVSAATRIMDKTNRIANLSTKSPDQQLVKDESIRDTLLDLATYCVMTVVEMDLARSCPRDKTQVDRECAGCASYVENDQYGICRKGVKE